MNDIEDFTIELDRRKLSWKINGQLYERKFLLPVNSAIELSDKSGFAIVGSHKEFGIYSAMIINNDNSLRAQLVMPEDVSNVICFHEIYYVNHELTGIIAGHYCDYACVIDETIGVCGNPHETR